MLRLKLSSFNKASEVWQCPPEKDIKGCVNSDRSCIGCMSFIEDELLSALFCQARYPPEDVYCRTTEFDNIKVFYHIDMPSLRFPQGLGSYTFYIGRAGCEPRECTPRTSEWMLLGSTIDAGNA